MSWLSLLYSFPLLLLYLTKPHRPKFCPNKCTSALPGAILGGFACLVVLYAVTDTGDIFVIQLKFCATIKLIKNRIFTQPHLYYPLGSSCRWLAIEVSRVLSGGCKTWKERVAVLLRGLCRVSTEFCTHCLSLVSYLEDSVHPTACANRINSRCHKQPLS